MKHLPQSITNQQGMAVLAITLTLLVAMTVITAIGARVAINSQRIAANAAHGEIAFQIAEAALDNVQAYLNHNRVYIASTGTNGWLNASSDPKWEACDSADTTPPCGDGTSNLYGSDWYQYGPVPNLVPADADHDVSVHLLSDNINDSPANDEWLGCLNLSVTSILPSGVVNQLNLINDLLSDLGSVLGLGGLGLPTDHCLPLNFSGSDAPSGPSSANPTIRAVAYSSNPADARGGAARLQQDLQTTSRFLWDPMAPMIVHGTPHLKGDFRVWGNSRPPTRAPYDWSILNLNDIAGLNVTDMIGSYLGTVATPLHAATLAPLLNLTVAEVLTLDWNVTFPLTIWSDETAQLVAGSTMDGSLLEVGRTCTPQFDNIASSTCLPMSLGVSVAQGAISDLVSTLQCLLLGLLGGCSNNPPADEGIHLKLPDVQDEHNLLSTVTGLLDTAAPIDFPDDLFAHVFGVPEVDRMQVLKDAVELQDCSDLHTRPSGFYYLDNVDCDMSGIVGTEEEPMLVVVDGGDASMAAGSEYYGVLFVLGPDNRKFDGDSTGGVRPTLFGALLSSATTHFRFDFNLVYHRDVIRRAGYRAGYVTRLPGGWSDEVTGP